MVSKIVEHIYTIIYACIMRQDKAHILVIIYTVQNRCLPNISAPSTLSYFFCVLIQGAPKRHN